MKIHLKIVVFVAVYFCIFTNYVIAQNRPQYYQRGMNTLLPVDSSDLPSIGAIDFCVGTSGLGLEYNARIAKGISIRIGYSHLPFSFTKIEQVGNVTINGYYKARFNNVHIFIDKYLFLVRQTLIKGVVGFSYFPKAEVNVHVTPVGKYMYGTINLNDGHMGDADILASWRGFAPFIGLSLGKYMNKSRTTYLFNIGTYYFLSAAKVDMTTSGYLEKNEIQRVQIQNNLKSYSWLPTIQMQINYKL